MPCLHWIWKWHMGKKLLDTFSSNQKWKTQTYYLVRVCQNQRIQPGTQFLTILGQIVSSYWGAARLYQATITTGVHQHTTLLWFSQVRLKKGKKISIIDFEEFWTVVLRFPSDWSNAEKATLISEKIRPFRFMTLQRKSCRIWGSFQSDLVCC